MNCTVTKGYYLVAHAPGYNGHVVMLNGEPALFTTRHDAATCKAIMERMAIGPNPPKYAIEEALGTE